MVPAGANHPLTLFIQKQQQFVIRKTRNKADNNNLHAKNRHVLNNLNSYAIAQPHPSPNTIYLEINFQCKTSTYLLVTRCELWNIYCSWFLSQISSHIFGLSSICWSRKAEEDWLVTINRRVLCFPAINGIICGFWAVVCASAAKKSTFYQTNELGRGAYTTLWTVFLDPLLEEMVNC